jgi:O-antigen/teichoic acid export membrane protein
VRTLGAAAGFVLLAHAVSVEELGVWGLYLTTAALLDTLREGLIRSGFVRFASAANPETFRSITGAAIELMVGATAASIIAVLCLAGMLTAAQLSTDLVALFLVYPIYALGSGAYSLATIVLQAKLGFGAILVARTASVVATVGGLGLAIALDTSSLTVAAVLAYAAGALAGALVAIPAAWGTLSGRPTRDADWTRRMLRHGRVAMATRLGSSAYRATDVYLLGAVLGPAAVGLYAVAWKIADLVELPLQAMVTVLMPDVSARAALGHQDAAAATRRAAAVLTATLIPITAAMAALAGDLLTVVGGPEYVAATSVLLVLCLFGLLRPADRTQGVLLDAIGRPGENLRKLGVTLTVNVVGNTAALATFGTDALPAVAGVSVLATLVGIAFAEWSLGPLALTARTSITLDSPLDQVRPSHL